MNRHIFINHILKGLKIIFQVKGKPSDFKKQLDAEIIQEGSNSVHKRSG